MTRISIRTLSTAGLCLIHEYGTQKPSCRKDKLYNSWWRPEVVVYQLSTTLGSCFYTYPSVTIANLWVEPSSWSVSHCSNSSRTSGNGLALSTVSCPNKQTNKQTIKQTIAQFSIYTKPVNIHFCTIWLATQAQDILWYPLVCKTNWTRMRVVTFPAVIWPLKLHILSLAIHWFGIYCTNTIIHLSVGE